MKDEKLIVYKEGIFTKIFKFFKNIFRKKNNDTDKDNVAEVINKESDIKKEIFKDSIKVKENEEEKYLKELQVKYENGEITDDELSIEDLDKLIERYKTETEKINLDTERRKFRISKMLKELKNEQ